MADFRLSTLLLLLLAAAALAAAEGQAAHPYQDLFKTTVSVQCKPYKTANAASVGDLHRVCQSACYTDSNCGGYTFYPSTTATAKALQCGLVDHEGVSDTCAYVEQTSRSQLLAVREIRSGVALADELSSQPMHLRCPKLTVITNYTVSIGSQAQSSQMLDTFLSTVCLGKQQCTLDFASAAGFLQTFQTELESLSIPADGNRVVSVSVSCGAGPAFNEDAYFNAWSMPVWSDAAEQAAARQQDWKNFLQTSVPAYPGSGSGAGQFAGRGVVVVGGGKYLEPALVLASRLRQLGYEDVVQIWHLGPQEVWPSAMPLVQELGVELKDFYSYVDAAALVAIPSNVGMRRFQLKPLAVLHSNLQEVLLLDADNIPLENPASLFEDADYTRTGALFWPDFWTTSLQNPIWQVMGLEAKTEWEQESGQILINKEKSWQALHLCVFLNSAFYMTLINGDKDSFRFAWKATATPFHMIPTWPSTVGLVRDLSQGQNSAKDAASRTALLAAASKRQIYRRSATDRDMGTEDSLSSSSSSVPSAEQLGVGMCGHTMLQYGPQGQPLFVHHNQMKDLVLPMGENFKYLENCNGNGPCRAAPSPGFFVQAKDVMVPCLELQHPGLRFVDQTTQAVSRSHLGSVEYFYSSAMRKVRAILRPDRLKYSRHQRTAPLSFNINGTGLTEAASVCGANQTETTAPTNNTDRICSLNASTGGELEFGFDVSSSGGSEAYQFQYISTNSDLPSTSNPQTGLTLVSSFQYIFTAASSVDSTRGMIITTSATGGSGAVSITSSEGLISGSPAFQGGSLVFRPANSLISTVLYYQAQGQTSLGGSLAVVNPSWFNLYDSQAPPESNNANKRFNTAFNPAAQVFVTDSPYASVAPTSSDVETELTACKAKCDTDTSFTSPCVGVFIFSSTSLVRCIGLSNTGNPTTTQLTGAQSWYKMKPTTDFVVASV